MSTSPLAPETTPRSLTAGRIEGSILVLRGHKVLLDMDLAALYGVTTKRFNEQVRRNKARFPSDFMFHLARAKNGHSWLLKMPLR